MGGSQRLLSIDATMNTAVVSRLEPEKFHSVSEGLGVMAHIPFCPTKLSAMEIIEALHRIIRLPFLNSTRVDSISICNSLAYLNLFFQ